MFFLAGGTVLTGTEPSVEALVSWLLEHQDDPPWDTSDESEGSDEITGLSSDFDEDDSSSDLSGYEGAVGGVAEVNYNIVH